MKVLFDARKLGDGGIGRYIENLLDGFLPIYEAQIEVLVSSQSDKLIKGSWKQHYRFINSEVKKYSIKELFSGGGKGYDLYHIPHYTLPFFTRCPTVITVHDLIHIKLPEKFYYPLIATPLISSAVKRADGVITVSEYSREELARLVPGSAAKIKFIPNAVSEKFIRANISTKNPLPKKTHLFAVFSNAKPHKAPQDLIKAFEIAAAELPAGIPLAIAGKGGAKLAIPDSIKSRVIILGDISDEMLAEYYSRAFALIVPSLLEGFCLQVIEAHANGVRCVTRPVRPVDELMTPHDIVAADNSIETLAAAIVRSCKLPTDEKISFDLSRYNVDLVTAQTFEYYKSVIASAA